MIDNVYGITLRAPNGSELRELVWLPTEETRREFYRKADSHGLEVIISD